MVDLLAEQARLRPALDRLLRLAVGWADPVRLEAPDGRLGLLVRTAGAVSTSDSVVARSAPVVRAETPDELPAPVDRATSVASPADAGAAATLPWDASSTSNQGDVDPSAEPFGTAVNRNAPRPAVAEPSGPAKTHHPALPSLPSFRLAPARRVRAAVPLRSFASGVLGTTAGAVPGLDLSGRRAADAPANRTEVTSSLPSAATFSGISGMRATPDASWESLAQCRHQATGTLTEASAFTAADEAGLEERIADILERAATDAGIDLP